MTDTQAFMLGSGCALFAAGLVAGFFALLRNAEREPAEDEPHGAGGGDWPVNHEERK